MTLMQMLTSGVPEHFHIVTDCPFLVPLYSDHEVFIWRDGRWVNPRFQTYACSYSMIISGIWGYEYTIPAATVNGETTNVMGHGIKRPALG